MQKKLVIEYWIDEKREAEANKILNDLTSQGIQGAYFSTKDGVKIIDVKVIEM